MREIFLPSNLVYTDNAYVDASLAQVTPQINGTIAEVLVRETQYVQRGQVLLRLDRADAELDVRSAKAAYEQAIRNIQQILENVKTAEAALEARRVALEQARTELQRRKRIASLGAISAEEVTKFQSTFDTARYELAEARHRAAAQNALVTASSDGEHPEVSAAKAALERAELRLKRTELRAPVDGIISQFHAQIGEQVSIGSRLMSIVPLDQLFVEANFKESQLNRIKRFQRVVVTSDLYGPSVEYQGRVEGLGGGTGAAFAIIPAQNATGNWIKVVQRLPVRISLDPSELKKHPLRVGISMRASIIVDGAPTQEALPSPPLLRSASSGAF